MFSFFKFRCLSKHISSQRTSRTSPWTRCSSAVIVQNSPAVLHLISQFLHVGHCWNRLLDRLLDDCGLKFERWLQVVFPTQMILQLECSSPAWPLAWNKLHLCHDVPWCFGLKWFEQLSTSQTWKAGKIWEAFVLFNDVECIPGCHASKP